MQPASLAVTSTAPGADAPDAPAAPALTLAADTRSVRQRATTATRFALPVRKGGWIWSRDWM